MNPVAFVSNPEPNLLVLSGEIDLHASPRMRKALTQMVEREEKRILIDLTAVTYMDSSGIAVLIETMQRTQGYGGQLALFGVPPRVQTVFEIAQLNQVLQVFPDKASALGV